MRSPKAHFWFLHMNFTVKLLGREHQIYWTRPTQANFTQIRIELFLISGRSTGYKMGHSFFYTQFSREDTSSHYQQLYMTCHNFELNSQSGLLKTIQNSLNKYLKKPNKRTCGGKGLTEILTFCRSGDGEVSVSQSTLPQLWTPILHMFNPSFSLQSER